MQGRVRSSVTGKSSQGDMCLNTNTSSSTVVSTVTTVPLSPHFLGQLIYLEMLSESTPVSTSSTFPLQGLDHTMRS